MKRLRAPFFIVLCAATIFVDVFYVPDLMNAHHGPTRALGFVLGALPWGLGVIAAWKLWTLFRFRREFK